MMYSCSECGHLFEDGEEARRVESHGEPMQGCPKCFSAFEEVKPCKICGSFNHEAKEAFCDECKKTVKKRFSDFVDSNFTKDERELLNELYDGEWI